MKNDDAKIKQNIKTEKNDIDESVCRLQNMELKEVNEKLERYVTRRKGDFMTGQSMDTQLKNLETKLGRHEDLTDKIKDEITTNVNKMDVEIRGKLKQERQESLHYLFYFPAAAFMLTSSSSSTSMTSSSKKQSYLDQSEADKFVTH